eukprot:TRINITY_DN3555_c0_g1_i3.p1 TRINITY_DN3555_c0_g1~~TRINITY_DN3555_c0_g1_i3.p1  ORF type:complete len:187 (-),score=61.69 TRINITY_DN3555_c0_g1_i3:27-515(-)
MVALNVDPWAHKLTMIATVALFFKFLFTALAQGSKRFNSGTRPPEDNKLSLAKGKPQHYGLDNNKDAADARTKKAIITDIRWQRIVLNDLENIPLGLIVAWGALFSASSPFLHGVLVIVFAISRTLHTVSYANELQPHRAIAWAGAVLSVIGLAVNGLVGVL